MKFVSKLGISLLFSMFIGLYSHSGIFPSTKLALAGSTVSATPSNYLSQISNLRPGDTLILQAGNYDSLPIYDLNGTESNPITISGPETGPRPVILGKSGVNTVRLDNASYVTVRNLEIDCRSLGGDGVNSQGTTHHITLENLYIHGFSDDQGTVGISTNRAPVWNWIIRNCVITDGGTGMYLGNSDGNEPFIAGLIENNLIFDTIGYNIEIKHQNPRPTNILGMPAGDSRTILRNNVFSKANNASTGDRARPNVLVGHFPLSGPGMNDVYEVYGNFFYQNPTGEPLFQGEGNIALYNNLFVNTAGNAMDIQPHYDIPRMIRVFHNTVLATDRGIRVTGGSSSYQQLVIANAVFAGIPIEAGAQISNVVASYSNAGSYLNNPFASPGQLDLYPKPGALTGSLIDSSPIASFTDWNKDFNGYPYQLTFRGAYAGEGQNPGWQPRLEIKTLVAPGSPAAPKNLRISK